MSIKRKNAILTILIILSCIILNYNPQILFQTNYQHWGWNFSLLASVIIILLMSIRSPGKWKEQLGIDFYLKDIGWFFVTTIIVLITSYFLVSYVSSLSGFSFKPQIIYFRKYWGADFPFSAILSSYLYYIPETFNEEMVIGALLLFGLEKSLKINKSIIALIVALIFSLMHQILYKYSPVQPGILLTPITLSTLFFVGVLRNSLILKTRKIAYSWAIHLSFNLIYFPGFFIDSKNGNFASEPEKFNITFGNWPMFFLTLLLAILSLFWLNKDFVKK